jgi:uncharacterized protein YyaL (SSP411 family)
MKKILPALIPFFLLHANISNAHPEIELKNAFLAKGVNHQPRTKYFNDDKSPKYTNHLILSDAPYLLQHAHNPINWYSWSEEAFEKAKVENKLIFLSIGYSSCHWCHVMEEESFDDEEVAKIMNKDFVAIKVDREVNPDVDATFMKISQMTTGGGGWPLNVFLTPTGDAFLTDTYIPKSKLVSNLPQIAEIWSNDSKKILDMANQNIEMMKVIEESQKKSKGIALNKDISEVAVKNLLSTHDEMEGGFGNAPKFPHEPILDFLLSSQSIDPSPEKKAAIIKSLDSMAIGGLYDVIGGGFHRYVVDNSWIVPHFEKMLYNQAQLALVYAKGYQLTRNPLYKRVAERTLDYVSREMTDENGLFYSATDADSEGEEGTFFVWTADELKNLLSEADYQLASSLFDFTAYTEFEGKNVIRYKSLGQLNPDNYEKIDQLIEKIYQLRAKRIPPFKDKKHLLSWNAMMAKSFMQIGLILNNKNYQDIGIKATSQMLSTFAKNDHLQRVNINNKTSGKALLEDYVFFIDALITAYDISKDDNFLQSSKQLASKMNDLFWDEEHYGYFMNEKSSAFSSSVKQIIDDAIPSTNGIASQILVKLFNRTGEKKYQDLSTKLLGTFGNIINIDPYSYTSFVKANNMIKNGELNKVSYAYDGKVRIQHNFDESNNLSIKLDLEKGWNVNANVVLQDNLIPTSIKLTDSPNWGIAFIDYPEGQNKKLGFSEESLSVYKETVDIKARLGTYQKIYNQPKLELNLQACSDKVCLPPTSVTLKL